jgi:transcriptional regulator with XRE-family HTH domain
MRAVLVLAAAIDDHEARLTWPGRFVARLCHVSGQTPDSEMLHGFSNGANLVAVPDSPRESTDREPTAFAQWLDSLVPAVFKNHAALARAVGVHRSYVAKWRRGVVPQVPALVKLADATGTSLETLLRVAGYQPPDTGQGSS